MVTAIRWMQKFVGRAESTLPFSTSAYLHLTTDFFSVQMEDFYQTTSVLATQRRLKELVLSPVWFLSKQPLWMGG